MARVLIVDDENNIRVGLRDVLKRDGHLIKEASAGDEALKILEGWSCDVAVVDIRMPGLSGIELLKILRERRPDLSVVMLTGHGTLQSAMAAIKKGAYDYLLKPARPADIRKVVGEAARHAGQRRAERQLIESLRTGLESLDHYGEQKDPADGQSQSAADQVLKIGELSVDLQRREVHVSGQLLSLSPTEYSLLAALASSPGHTLDYLSLAEIGLGYPLKPAEAKDLIKRHIFAIRKKLEQNAASKNLIQNIRGFGYRLPAS